MTVVTSTALPARRPRDGHIIDALIAERAPRLAASPLWPVARPLLYGLLDYSKARAMAEAIAPLSGAAALEHVSALLGLRVSVHGLERLPAAGRVILVCNHPTGIADGVAVYDALKARRPDIAFYANADAHRIAPRLGEVLIPVEWVEAKRTRLTLQLTRQALEAERPLVIFPSGRLARRGADGTLRDPPWMASAASLARRHDTPIIPMHLSGPWSTLFHLFNRVSSELRDITLFHELLNKRGRAFSLIVGRPVPPAALDPDPNAAVAALQTYVETVLPREPDGGFPCD